MNMVTTKNGKQICYLHAHVAFGKSFTLKFLELVDRYSLDVRLTDDKEHGGNVCNAKFTTKAF